MNVTLLNDILFKIVFGTEVHSEALRGLLNAILHLEGARRITEITILNPTREKVYLEGIKTAMKATHNAMSDEEVRYAIEARQKYQRDRVTELNVAVEEAEAKGELLGRARAARAMRDEGISEEVVFRTTGLRFADL